MNGRDMIEARRGGGDPRAGNTSRPDTRHDRTVEPKSAGLERFAVDANELIRRMHAGEAGDFIGLINRSLADRDAA